VVFTFTLPNATLVVLAVSAATAAFSVSKAVSDTPPALAVNVAVSDVLTAVTAAVKLALVAPAATVTVDGTVTALLLLARFTATPPLPAAEFNVTVHESDAAPVNELLAQANPLSTGVLAVVPFPLSVTTIDPLLCESLASVSCPVAGPGTVGSKFTLNAAVCPGESVSGKVAPDIENPEPVTVAEFTVTDSVPLDDRVSGWVATEPTITLPKSKLVELTFSPGVTASSCTKKVSETPFALADIVTDCADVTAATVAVKLALLAPAAISTVLGTLTFALLLFNATARPPLGAAAFSVTVQLSLPAPMTDPFVQVNALSAATLLDTPVPLRSAVIVPLLAALLVIASCPVAFPVPVGAKVTPSL